MIVTFQLQVDPTMVEQEFTPHQLQQMQSDMEDFKMRLERFSIVRAQMYVDGEARWR